jgi:hypothetical protein
MKPVMAISIPPKIIERKTVSMPQRIGQQSPWLS